MHVYTFLCCHIYVNFFKKSWFCLLRAQRAKPFFLILKWVCILFFTWSQFSIVIQTQIVPCWSHAQLHISPGEVRLGGVENSPVTQHWLLYANGLIGCIIEASNWVLHLNNRNDTRCIIYLQKHSINMFSTFILL